MPTPTPVASRARRSTTGRRWAAVWPLIACSMIPLMNVLRRHYAIDVMVAQNRVLLERLMLVAAGCAMIAVPIAAIGFGMKAWRGARVVR